MLPSKSPLCPLPQLLAWECGFYREAEVLSWNLVPSFVTLYTKPCILRTLDFLIQGPAVCPQGPAALFKMLVFLKWNITVICIKLGSARDC